MLYPCGDGIYFDKCKWSFEDKKVVEVFEEHIEKQIPGYDLTHRIAIDIIQGIEKDGTIEILDLGCSKGTFEQKLNQELDYYKDIEIYAVDSSDEMIRNAYKGNNVHYICNDIVHQLRHYYQRDKKFDVIVSLFSLQFLTSYQEDAIRLIRKVINPNGIIIIADKYSVGENGADAQKELENYKKLNGYTRDEIEGKRFALVGRQRPLPKKYMFSMLGDFFRNIEVVNLSKSFSVFIFRGGMI